jgi:CTP synthase
MLQKENLDTRVLEKLGLKLGKSDLSNWERLVDKIHNLKGSVKIGIVGKYTVLKDAYISIAESLKHGGYHHGKNVEVVWINSESIGKDCIEDKKLSEVDGILIPYGFGQRGIAGKIEAAKYARENGIPFFGICLGLQCSVIEFSKNVLGIKDANSSEFDPDTKNPVIDLMFEQKSVKEKGGTMRLGSYKCRLKKGSNAYKAYGKENIRERHRHRFELNNKYIPMLEKAGMIITGVNPDKDLAEIIEIKNHPWFLAVQFHPEFKSRPDKPHPLFKDFIGAATRHSLERKKLTKGGKR